MLVNEFCVSLAKSNIDPEIPAFIPAEALKRLSHGRNTVGRLRILLSGRKQDTDALHLLALLRARRERPRRRRATEQRDELATRNHSITSSARASTAGGMSRPSALAVLRLTISSYFTAHAAAAPPRSVMKLRRLTSSMRLPLPE